MFLCVFYNIVTTIRVKREDYRSRIERASLQLHFPGAREYHSLTELDLFRRPSTEAVGVSTRVESQAKSKSRVARSPP